MRSSQNIFPENNTLETAIPVLKISPPPWLLTKLTGCLERFKIVPFSYIVGKEISDVQNKGCSELPLNSPYPE